MNPGILATQTFIMRGIFRTLELIVPKFDGIYIHVKNIKMFFGNSSMLKLVFAKRSVTYKVTLAYILGIFVHI